MRRMRRKWKRMERRRRRIELRKESVNGNERERNGLFVDAFVTTVSSWVENRTTCVHRVLTLLVCACSQLPVLLR